jgi:predicted O-methyltransferase YrrM
LKLPGNISYLFKLKKNHLLPQNFDDYLLNIDLKPYSILEPDYYRKKLLNSKDKIVMSDFGAGSNKFKSNERIVGEVASISGTSSEFGLFYHKIVQEFRITKILELGTSVGIATNYFATASKSVKVTGIEACRQTCEFLCRKLEKLNITNVEIVNNDFDSVFDNNLLGDTKFDLVFIDGNHRGSAVLKYYEILLEKNINSPSIIIVDDINWSRDMHNAWEKIVNMDKSKTYLNLFRSGLVFSGYDMPTGEYPINFVNNQIF